MLELAQLHNYQWRAAQFALDVPKCALWVGLGLGKTVTILTLAKMLKMTGDADSILIVAPLNVARHVWTNEVVKWSHTQDITVSKILGTPKQRLAALAAKADIHIINRENLVWLLRILRVEGNLTLTNDFPWDMVVLDESSSFKAATSQRFKALKQHSHQIKRMVQLTATPSGNSLLGLWPQAYLLDQGRALGRTMSAYKQEYFYKVDKTFR